MGVRLAVDDFGTGNSAIAYIKRFPFDTLKIDQSFVRGMLESPHDAAITGATVAMAQQLDLTIVAEATGSTVVQRHSNSSVRAVGGFGVLRSDGMDWHLEPPIDRWLNLSGCANGLIDPTLLDQFLRFAVHDVAARGVGATFLVSPGGRLLPGSERRYGKPPDLRIDRPSDLAPLYHILGQLDGAAVFDERGELQELGVRLVPSATAEASVEPYRGTRHTSALRYSYDDPEATIIVVSEDGPVSVLRAGRRLGQSA